MNLGLGLFLGGSRGRGVTDPLSAGAVWWLRSDLGISQSGGVVTGWADQSGLGDANRNAAPAGADKPAYNASVAAYNNLPTIGTFMVGTDCRLITGTWSATYSAFTLIVIGHAAGASNRYFTFEQNSDYIAMVSLAGASTRILSGSAGGTSIVGGPAVSTAKSVYVAEFNGASSKLYVNSLSSASVTGTLAASTLGNAPINLGSFPAASATNSVDAIAEVIALPYAISANAAAQAGLKTYFNTRYGIAIT